MLEVDGDQGRGLDPGGELARGGKDHPAALVEAQAVVRATGDGQVQSPVRVEVRESEPAWGGSRWDRSAEGEAAGAVVDEHPGYCARRVDRDHLGSPVSAQVCAGEPVCRARRDGRGGAQSARSVAQAELESTWAAGHEVEVSVSVDVDQREISVGAGAEVCALGRQGDVPQDGGLGVLDEDHEGLGGGARGVRCGASHGRRADGEHAPAGRGAGQRGARGRGHGVGNAGSLRQSALRPQRRGVADRGPLTAWDLEADARLGLVARAIPDPRAQGVGPWGEGELARVGARAAWPPSEDLGHVNAVEFDP